MNCPSCSSSDTAVIDSREAEGGSAIRRRRKCLDCGVRFSTYEVLAESYEAPRAAARDQARVRVLLAEMRGILEGET